MKGLRTPIGGESTCFQVRFRDPLPLRVPRRVAPPIMKELAAGGLPVLGLGEAGAGNGSGNQLKMKGEDDANNNSAGDGRGGGPFGDKKDPGKCEKGPHFFGQEALCIVSTTPVPL